jgi:hypothetical protein
MNYYIKILKDSIDKNYVGIEFSPEIITPFLDQLEDILGDKYEEYTKLQQQRDRGKYHLTLLPTMEFNQISARMGYDKFLNYLEGIFKVEISDLKLLGLGKAENAGNEAYYIVVKSEMLDVIRENLELTEKDFHITLGVKWKDVHGVRKNEIMKPSNGFLKKLKSSYLNEGETFEFIKGIKNFDLDFLKLIEPISINDSTAVFRCGDNDYIQLSLIDDNLSISGKWQDTNKLPILSNNLVTKKFKQI